MAGDERIRLFCGLPLPARAAAGLVDWQGAHLREGRLVPVANLHVTLAFLGHRPRSELPAIADALRQAAAAAGAIALRPVRYRETRSVGMIVLEDVHGAGAALADDLGTRLADLGVYRREARPWLAHVTVLRFRDRPRLAPPPPVLGNVVPSDAAVYSSVLRPDGAQYVVLESVALGGR